MPDLRIGITGAGSFIGRTISARLSREGAEPLPFTGDITNPRDVSAFVESCDTVFHLAGRNRGRDIDVFQTNAAGSSNIACAAVTLGNRHIIYPSSKHVERNPESAYSRGKAAAERALTDIAGVRGCKSTVFRLPNVYGPGALPFYVSVISTFCYLKANGRADEMPIVGDGSQVVEFVPVDAVVDSMLAARSQEADSALADIPGHALAISELAEIIRSDTRLAEYPSIAECVDVFAGKPPVTQIKWSDISQTPGTVDFRSLAPIIGDTEIGSLSLLDVPDGFGQEQRQTSGGTDWVLLLQGRLVVDLYASDGSYVNSSLLECGRVGGIGIEGGYQYAVRSIGETAGMAVVIHGNKTGGTHLHRVTDGVVVGKEG